LRRKGGVIATHKHSSQRWAECQGKLPNRHTAEDGLRLKALEKVVHVGAELATPRDPAL
jgi:hypothetical protein